MTDTRTPEQRRRIMTAVRQKDTSPEILVRRALFAAGVRGWRCHYKPIAGKPDLAWPVLRVALFVDGAFWHGHPSRHRPGRSGVYWDQKIARNVERDREVDAALKADGWTALRVWDFEIRRELPNIVDRTLGLLADSIEELNPPAALWHHALRAQRASHASDVTDARAYWPLPDQARVAQLIRALP